MEMHAIMSLVQPTDVIGNTIIRSQIEDHPAFERRYVPVAWVYESFIDTDTGLEMYMILCPICRRSHILYAHHTHINSVVTDLSCYSVVRYLESCEHAEAGDLIGASSLYEGRSFYLVKSSKYMRQEFDNGPGGSKVTKTREGRKRCSALSKNGTQCGNHADARNILCQTHHRMDTPLVVLGFPSLSFWDSEIQRVVSASSLNTDGCGDRVAGLYVFDRPADEVLLSLDLSSIAKNR